MVASCDAFVRIVSLKLDETANSEATDQKKDGKASSLLSREENSH